LPASKGNGNGPLVPARAAIYAWPQPSGVRR
jgi:hypothetical protein